MRIISNFKIYEIKEREEYFKIYIYKLKKGAICSFDAEGLYTRSFQELENCNIIDSSYRNEELYYFNKENKLLALGHLINDIMNSDIM